jgi:cytochrome c oxidase cbb3-type subunit 3
MEQYVQSTMTHPFWSIFIIVGTLGGIIGCVWLIRWMSGPGAAKKGEKAETMGHVWDENLEEYNNPLPSWWLWMFYITLVFGTVYLILYPGLGAWGGVFKWTSVGQYEEEMKQADEKYGPIYAQYADKPVEELIKNEDAVQMGQRLYLTYCTVCHGSDATGAGKGYPNLTDSDWLYGGSPDMIKVSIAQGRNSNGIMAAWGPQIGEEAVKNVTQYVLSLSDREHDAAKAEAGKQTYMTVCIACHGPEGKGIQAMGAPNLTDNIWLFGGSVADIEEGVRNGRHGVMPPHGEFLGDDKIHVLTTYIYSLSNK